VEKYEGEQIDAIVWSCYKVEDGLHNDIPWQGASMAGNLVDFKGEPPPPSAYKCESISAKAEQLARYSVTNFDKYAHGLLHCMPDDVRFFLLAPLRLQVILRRVPSGVRVAEFLDMEYDFYREKKKRYRKQVLKLDKMMRPHAYQKKTA